MRDSSDEHFLQNSTPILSQKWLHPPTRTPPCELPLVRVANRPREARLDDEAADAAERCVVAEALAHRSSIV